MGLGDTVQAILLCFLVDRWYCGKVNQGLMTETGDTNEILDSLVSCLMIAK